MTQPPPHKTERVFRQYEHCIQQILDEWPGPTVFDPRPFSAETFSCGLRRAIRSLREYGWTTTLDTLKVNALRIVVSATIQPGKIVAGDHATIITKLRLQPGQVSSVGLTEQQLVPRINLDAPTEELVVAVITLHAYRILIEPSTIQNTSINVDKLCAGKDIFVEFDDKTNTYIIT